VQGGYGKYQGTWIPYDRAVDLAEKYEVRVYLEPILEFDPPVPGSLAILTVRSPTRLQHQGMRSKSIC
jgi:regulatory protein SWI6